MSTLRPRLEATMSAKRPGSSRFSMTTMTSGIRTLPRLTIRSICSFTVRITASASSGVAAGFVSGTLSMRTE